ncbi:phosphatase PAP2 family protein [Nocardioides taihuensis]|uniref:Phosphatase PAP2 family protein n=1 Tax=Nocardioides taihuensis TaxID=1835606 RepID=A0ABW0BPF2_9ACTN
MTPSPTTSSRAADASTRPHGGSSGRGWLSTSATVLVAWAVILGAVLAVGWLITGPFRSGVEPWDDDVSRWFADQRTPTLTTFADAGTLLGETPVGAGVAAVVAIALSVWKRSWRPAAFFALLIVGIGGFYAVATMLITRLRPPVKILDPGLVPNDSFPSGHVATATAAYAGTAVVVWFLAPALRRWVAVLFLLPLVEVLSRLYEGAHHLTDVATSVLYTTAWMAVLITALILPGRERTDQ